MDLDQQRNYYDRRWAESTLEELDSDQVVRLEQILRALAMIADRPRPWRILEVGCGTGWLSGILLRYGKVTGIDLSRVGIDIARKRYPQVEFIARDIFAEPLPPIHDLVVASESIEHVIDQGRFVDLLVDAACPGGYLLLTTPNGRVERRWKRRPDFHPQPIEQWLHLRALRVLLSRRCEVRWLTTFFYDFDREGLYGLIHNPWYEGAMKRLGLSDLASRLWGRLGLGLYAVALARRR